MMLYQTSIMELHYTPTSDILRIEWPDINKTFDSDLKYSFFLVGEALKVFNIKKLLIDSTKSTIIPDPEYYLESSRNFIAAISSTGLRKMARVQSRMPAREIRTNAIISMLPETDALSFEYRSFGIECDAVEWLLND